MKCSRAACIAGSGGHRVLLLFSIALLIGAVAALRVTGGTFRGRPDGEGVKLDRFALMIPRAGLHGCQPAGQRSLEIVGARRGTGMGYCIITAQGEQFQCAPDEYVALRHGGRISASIVYVPSTSLRSTAWITSHVVE